MSDSMRERTGRIDGTAAEAVFYRLLRDGDISPGRLEAVVKDVSRAHRSGTKTFQFTNGYLALYAKDVVARLMELAEA